MKKLVTFLCVVLCCACMFADGMNIGVIGTSNNNTANSTSNNNSNNYGAVRLYKDKLAVTDIGEVKVTDMKIEDTYGVIAKGRTGYYSSDANIYKSGREYEYVKLYIDILNLNLDPVSFTKNFRGNAVYDNKLRIPLSMLQVNHDKNSDYKYNVTCAIDPSEYFEINAMCNGHYLIVGKLPNAVVERKEPLVLQFSINGQDFQYVIR